MTTRLSVSEVLRSAAPKAENPLPPLVNAGRARQRVALPYRSRDSVDGTGGEHSSPALILENDCLRVTVLPALGGRIESLYDKGSRRELVPGGDVAGGIEWNLGDGGFAGAAVVPMYAAEVDGPDGTPALRLWEWERTRDLACQVDLWLPEDSSLLLVGVKVRNPHDHAVPVGWSSNIIVSRTVRLLGRPRESSRWTAAVGEDGAGLVQLSVSPSNEHVAAGGSWHRLEAFGPCYAGAAAWRGDARVAATDLERRLPDAGLLGRLSRAWLGAADNPPRDPLSHGSGWGALETHRMLVEFPATPYPAESMGVEQRSWLSLLDGTPWTGDPVVDPGPTPVNAYWRELLEYAPATWTTWYHRGVARWAAGERRKAADAWAMSLAHAENPWALRNLAVVSRLSGDTGRAARRYARAVELAPAVRALATEARLAAENPARPATGH
ncbi:hypothetical protein ACFWY9_24090 [Amycolatopsis sp. NPDC059027]|uniref:hypothetical protein n=1 Tax=Amycolatopsis sp. NPDC059027 TaxID=3346709 RepID=UPI003670466C